MSTIAVRDYHRSPRAESQLPGLSRTRNKGVLFAAGIISAASTLLAGSLLAAAPVQIVVGPDAPPLERLAATELSAGLERLHDFSAEVATRPAADLPAILVGSPATNPAIAAALGAAWPKLSDQGHLVKSVKSGTQPLLILGGNRPVTTFWAVAEYLHRSGLRALLQGDFVAVEHPPLNLAGFDLVVEPRAAWRGWMTGDGGAAGWQAWSLADHRRLLRQLAKQKFTHLVIHAPIKDAAGGSWRVDGDTAGRKAFQGAKVFENADLAGIHGEESRRKAEQSLSQSLADAAREWGLVPVSADDSSVAKRPVIQLFEPAAGLLPQLRLSSLATVEVGQPGWTLHALGASDAELPTYFFSRRESGMEGGPRVAAEELITSIAGPGVAERLLKGFEYVEKATELIRANDPRFAAAAPDMVVRLRTPADPVPAWWAEVRDLYTEAMNEMYRGNTRAREGGRDFILYFARRHEFGLTYLTSLEALRLSAVAHAKQDSETESQQLESAVEGMYNALGAFSEVARDPSDRGTIALLNEWGYRPLQKLLDQAP